MERAAHVPDHPKKRRRKPGNRRQVRSKEPISARLVLDYQLRGDTGVLSEDLVADLFPGLHLEGEGFKNFPSAIVASEMFSNVDMAYTQVRPRRRPRDTTCRNIAMVAT